MSGLGDMSARGGLLLWAAALFGCAGLPPVPSQGGPAWRRVESEHFILYSDQSASGVRDTAQTFERLLDAYYQLGWEAQGKLPIKLHVVVFDDRSDFELFAGETVGFYMTLPPFEPMVVMPNLGRIERWRTLKHELTHFIAYQSVPFQPLWLSEGLASYFQTAYFDIEGRFVVGEADAYLFDVLRALGRLPAQELLHAESIENAPKFYASSWLLVHYLMSNRGDAFAKYQDALAQAKDPAAAWATAFPDLTVGTLDGVLTRYLREGRYTYFARPLKPYAGPEPNVTELSSADIYALRAQLFMQCSGCGAEERRLAAENVEQALRLEPHHLRASIVRFSVLPKAQRVPAAQALTRAHPESQLAWYVLAGAEISTSVPPRCTPDVTSRLRGLGKSSARALMLVATCQALAGDKQDALDLVASALRRQPADTTVLMLQAVVLLTLRECLALQPLVPRLRTAVHAKVAPEFLARLERCGRP